MLDYMRDSKSILQGQHHQVADVFDVSIREQGTTTVYGQTTKSMLEDFEAMEEFGAVRKQIASFNFRDLYTVQDQFVEVLKDRQSDLEGCFAAFPLEDYDVSLKKFDNYQIPNLFIDVFFAHADSTFIYEEAHQKAELLIKVLKQARKILAPAQINPKTGKPIGEIYINFGDYFEQREHVSFFDDVFTEVKKVSFQGVCFEEFRGISLLEDIYSATQYLREHFPHGQYQILSHIHGGNGLEDAANLVAAVAGANGVWSALTPLSSLSSHGSSLVYLTNLIRYGNPQVEQKYNMKKSYQISKEMYLRSFANQEQIPRELPVIGRNAYNLNRADLSQEDNDIPNTIPSQKIGRTLSHRFVPLLYDHASIQARFAELGFHINHFQIEQFTNYVHQRLVDDFHYTEDTRIDFDSPEFLKSYICQSLQKKQAVNFWDTTTITSHVNLCKRNKQSIFGIQRPSHLMSIFAKETSSQFLAYNSFKRVKICKTPKHRES